MNGTILLQEDYMLPETSSIELYDIRKAAKMLNIAEVTLRRLVKSRKIPFHRINRKYLFTKENLKQYLEDVSYPIIKEDI